MVFEIPRRIGCSRRKSPLPLRMKLFWENFKHAWAPAGLENPQIFQTPEVVRAGGLAALQAFGKPAEILHETKERMFAT